MKRLKKAFDKLRRSIITASLLALLFVVEIFVGGSIMGCDEEPKAVYGPAPINDSQSEDLYQGQTDIGGDAVTPIRTDVAIYGPLPADIVTDSTPATYYGPQPTDTISTDTAPSEDLGEATYYGPQPTDVVLEDVPEMNDLEQTLYGPRVDDITDQVDQVDHDQVMAYYGPQPIDLTPEEDTVLTDTAQAWYGPPT
jgi:hypothetical protein